MYNAMCRYCNASYVQSFYITPVSAIPNPLSEQIQLNARYPHNGNSTDETHHCRVTDCHTELREDNPQLIRSDQPDLQQLLSEFADIFSKNRYDINALKIEPPRLRLTSDIPISLRPYRASFKDNEEIKTQIDELLKHKIIEPSCSPYSFPVIMATKKDEGQKTRMCIDYRKLNSVLKADNEPIPRIDTILDTISEARIYSCLDLASGYWNVPIADDDKEKTAFICQFGLFQWNRLPFGLKSAPSIFQRVIKQILNKYQIQCCLNYFDDLIVFSQDREKHLQDLRQVFTAFQKEGVKLKFSKCQLAKTSLNYLGFEITEGRYSPSLNNLEIIKALPKPTNVKKLQSFLGSINVYHKFIPNYAKLRQPLNNLLKKDSQWDWSPECEESFQKLKDSLTTKPILRMFSPSLPCHLFVDASTAGIGSILKQKYPNGDMHPIAYHSRKLRDYEVNYTISELECLAIVDSVDKFHCYLHGQTFTIHSDHAALQWLKSIKKPTGRLFRWSLRLSMYDYTVKYQKGSQNFEADMLSRNPVCHFLTTEEIKNQQQIDNVSHKNYIKIDDIITVKRQGLHKIVVPPSLQLKLITKVHEEHGHPGVIQTLKLISPYYYWRNIIVDVSNYIKHCETCQAVKKSKQKKFGLLESLPPATKPFELMSIDTIGGLQGYGSTKKYIHQIVDHHSRYIWAFSSKSTTIEAYTNCLKQVFQVGIPQKFLSDRYASFTSPKFRRFLESYGIKQLLTSTERPQCNGKNERSNQTIVTRLRTKHHLSPKTPWPKLLEQATQEYNNTPHTVTEFPPSYLMFGDVINKPDINIPSAYPNVEEARKIATEKTENYHQKNKIIYDRKFQEANFKEGDLVMLENYHHPNMGKLTPAFHGPFTILRKTSPVNFEIDKQNQPLNKTSEIVHSSKLRPYYDPGEFQLSVEKPEDTFHGDCPSLQETEEPLYLNESTEHNVENGDNQLRTVPKSLFTSTTNPFVAESGSPQGSSVGNLLLPKLNPFIVNNNVSNPFVLNSYDSNPNVVNNVSNPFILNSHDSNPNVVNNVSNPFVLNSHDSNPNVVNNVLNPIALSNHASNPNVVNNPVSNPFCVNNYEFNRDTVNKHFFGGPLISSNCYSNPFISPNYCNANLAYSIPMPEL